MGLRDDLLARCRFPEPGSDVSCAVSGGADSLSLLLLAVAAGCRATAIHVDHGLRHDSEREADRVAAAAARYGARFRSEQVTVLPGANLQARARAARYGVLPADVLTGHTADDQAETMVLNLLRGAGRPGLAGMRRTQRRPLLDLRRAETAALCVAEGLDPLVDPTNQDPTHRRTRVRHEVLPLLDDVAGRSVVPILARQAEILGEETEYLDRHGGRPGPHRHPSPAGRRAGPGAPGPAGLAVAGDGGRPPGRRRGRSTASWPSSGTTPGPPTSRGAGGWCAPKGA